MRAPVLLLTATITPPPGVPALARVDPSARLADYSEALRFYRPMIGSVFGGIVFAENSGSDLSQLKAHSPGVDFVSFDGGLDFPVSHGRGYGEMRLLEYAMEHSALLRQASVVWKCTGRYRLVNIARLARTRPEVDLYVHCRNHPYRLAELFAMSFTQAGFERVLRGMAPALRNDLASVHLNEERSFRHVVEAAAGIVSICYRFRHTPVIEGVRGWNNGAYSGARSAKILLRRVANALAPVVWI